MKSRFHLATGVAFLMLGTTAALAQTMDYEFYVTGEGADRMVVSRSGGEPMPILQPDAGMKAGERPANCPDGQFYMAGDDMVASCDDDRRFTMTDPGDATTDTGQPLGDGAMILTPEEDGGAKSDGSATIDSGGSGQSNAGASTGTSTGNTGANTGNAGGTTGGVTGGATDAAGGATGGATGGVNQ